MGKTLTNPIVFIVILLLLVLPVLAACNGEDDESEQTENPTQTNAPTADPLEEITITIGVISDIHENSANLRKAYEILKDHEIKRVLCLGDLINPGIAKILAGFDFPVYSIWGNNDGDKVLITKFSLAEKSNLEMSDRTYAFLNYDGCRIFISHYPELAEPMASSGKYDLVCYGHDHKTGIFKIHGTLVLNPGELSGLLTGVGTFAIFDTENKEAEIIEVI